ncbi:photosystem II biosynthesis protein [Acaryochloris sp. IP29b_bin.137]|uniref:photosystem II biosynthesis protein n=1 Tax=Acaryochloris sp. IP29b_bin.137 TaxID=2969217 RepID=UPI00260F8FEA|nr:photosystem II biosynthesis protein [Acaryochloris sp. IP29b_bin.137]
MAPKTEGNNANNKAGFGLDLADASAPDSKKKAKSAPKLSAKASKSKKKQKKAKRQKREAPSSIIPKVVSNRMIRRVGIFSGIPTLLAFSTIPTSYFVTEQGWVEFPSTVVLFVSITFLALGLVGVSYGIISASWDEDIKGSAIGISEFRLNLGRIQERRKIQKEERKRIKEEQAKAEKEKTKAEKQSAKAESTESETKTEASEEESADA